MMNTYVDLSSKNTQELRQMGKELHLPGYKKYRKDLRFIPEILINWSYTGNDHTKLDSIIKTVMSRHLNKKMVDDIYMLEQLKQMSLTDICDFLRDNCVYTRSRYIKRGLALSFGLICTQNYPGYRSKYRGKEGISHSIFYMLDSEHVDWSWHANKDSLERYLSNLIEWLRYKEIRQSMRTRITRQARQ